MTEQMRVPVDFYLAATDRALLDEVAARVGIAPEEVVEILVGFGLRELERGNEELNRAVRTSRDG